MTMYSDAATAIADAAADKLQRLETEHATARRENIAAQKKQIRETFPADDPWRPVCEYLAHVVTVTTAYRNPLIDLPADAARMLTAALLAGMPRPAWCRLDSYNPDDSRITARDLAKRANDYDALTLHRLNGFNDDLATAKINEL